MAKKHRPTLRVGYINRNGQLQLGRTGLRSTKLTMVQYIYRLRCLKCRHVYGAQGCDVWQRHCPGCQGGADGEPLTSEAWAAQSLTLATTTGKSCTTPIGRDPMEREHAQIGQRRMET
jgi:hypothetical protein